MPLSNDFKGFLFVVHSTINGTAQARPSNGLDNYMQNLDN